MNKAVVYIGVDVAKASLDVAWAEHSRRFANNKSGLSATYQMGQAKSSCGAFDLRS